jgi:L-asparaginase
MQKILIISTGGTFNKVYNPLSGELQIDKSSKAIEHIASKWLCDLEILNIIGKDSLEMMVEDRVFLAKTIKEQRTDKIIVIHGTDTMDTTAAYLNDKKLAKTIILTGAMVPYAIDPTEATANLASAYGYLMALKNTGVFIAMNGTLGAYNLVKKNRIEGKFTLVS